MDIVPLVNKVLSGIASPDETKQLEHWKTKHPENNNEFESLKLLWEHSSTLKGFHGPDQEFQEGWTKINNRINEIIKKKKTVRRKNNLQYLVSMVFLFGLLTYLLFITYLTPAPTQIRFDNTTFKNVIIILEKEWNVSIEVNKIELLNCRFTGILYGKSSPTEMIAGLAMIMGWEYEVKTPERFTIKGNGCNQQPLKETGFQSISIF